MEEMRRNVAVPDAITYSTAAVAFSKAGRCAEAMALIHEAEDLATPAETLYPMYKALLEAHRRAGDMESAARVRAVIQARGLRRLGVVARFEFGGTSWECGSGWHVEAVRSSPGLTSSVRRTSGGGRTLHEAPQRHRLSVTEPCRSFMTRLRQHGGFRFNTSVLHADFAASASRDEVERSLSYHAEKKALAALLLLGDRPRSRESQGALRVEVNFKMCADCHEAFRCAARLWRRHLECRDGARLHRFDPSGRCSCGGMW